MFCLGDYLSRKFCVSRKYAELPRKRFMGTLPTNGGIYKFKINHDDWCIFRKFPEIWWKYTRGFGIDYRWTIDNRTYFLLSQLVKSRKLIKVCSSFYFFKLKRILNPKNKENYIYASRSLRPISNSFHCL